MRYLGIYIDIGNTWENQYERIRSKVAETVRVITKARASPAIKWYALSMCGYASITYPAKFAPWTLAQYQDLVKPLDAALRNIHACRASSPVSLIYGAHRFGQLGLPSLHDRKVQPTPAYPRDWRATSYSCGQHAHASRPEPGDPIYSTVSGDPWVLSPRGHEEPTPVCEQRSTVR
jgi:hypothetical protein